MDTNDYIREMEPINKRLNEVVKVVKEAVEEFIAAYESEYNVIRTKFDAYFKKEGFITPFDADDFLIWLSARYPDEPTGQMVNEAKNPRNYRLFHEYNVKRLNEDWDWNKELIYWQNNNTPDKITAPNENTVFKFTALQWASIFHYAVGLDLPPNSDKVTERIREFRTKHTCLSTKGEQLSEKSLLNKYFNAKKSIDVAFDYKIANLEKIIPFMREHYSDTIDTIKNDIEILKKEQS